MSRLLCSAAIALALFAAPGPAAEILLDGHQHMGNNQGRCEFKPDDPVTHNQILNYPNYFHLSQPVTINGLRLNGALGLDNKLEVVIDGQLQISTCASCTSCRLPGTITCGGNNSCGDVVIDLTVGKFLPAGDHTISVRDAVSAGNDIGFSSISLLSDNPSTSFMLTQRRHPGNNALAPTDNDADDDYDITDNTSPYYPDISEPYPLDMGFTLSQNRRLSDIRFYRLRDVDNAAPNQARVFIDGQQVGVLVNTGDPLEANPTIIPTNFLALAGAHTLRVDLGVISGSDVDSFSWDSIIIGSVDIAPSGALGAFNAVEVGLAALNGVIKTKIANKNHDLDIYAINPLGSGVNTSYTGTVTVELLDASNSTGAPDIYGCRSSWTAVHTLGSVTFGGGDNGKKRLSVTPYPDALQVARVRVTDSSTGARGCSTDALAVRPKEFQAVASDNDASTPGLTRPLPTGGYSSNSAPIHKADRPFTLLVTPLAEGGGAVIGYSGQPTVTAIVLELGTVLGSVAMTPPWTVSGGVLRNDSLRYSEVGAVRLRVEDTSFANIDLADSTDTERWVRKDDVRVGRFVPDQFTVTKNTLDPACGSFTYVGQTFGYAAGAAVTLTAVSGLGTTTLGYTGSLGFNSKLSSIAQATFGIYDDPGIAGSPTLSFPAGSHSVSDLGGGLGRISLPNFSVNRPGSPLASFSAEVGIEFDVFSDSDGVLPAESPIVMGTATNLGGAPFTGGINNKQMRYGRLYLESGYGSDRTPLNLPARTEFWDGTSFVPSTGDSCTLLQTANVALLTPVPGAVPAQTRTLAPAGPGPGPWTVTLSAPNVAGAAVLLVDLSVVGPYPFLLDDNSDGDGLFNNNPRGSANFGLFNRSQDNRIYQREVFR